VSQAGEAAAYIAVDPGTVNEVLVPIDGRLVVGRECAGVDERHRLLIRDGSVSRSHLEISLDVQQDRAWAVDTSSNGTLLNGSAMQPAMPVPLRSGDQLTLGAVTLQFRSSRFAR
jgi:predicted component of type VI protein secretion system